MAGFTQGSVRFSGKIDSKGRVTIPARIRKRLGIGSGDRISISVKIGRLIEKKMDSEKEALEFLNSLDKVKSFKYDGDKLEVVLDD